MLSHAGPEAKGSNPTTGLTLLWARNPFRGNFNHWQVSWKEAGQIFSNNNNNNNKPNFVSAHDMWSSSTAALSLTLSSRCRISLYVKYLPPVTLNSKQGGPHRTEVQQQLLPLTASLLLLLSRCLHLKAVCRDVCVVTHACSHVLLDIEKRDD